MKILVIEDEARILSFLARGLEAEGYRVEGASDGRDGLARAVQGEWDLVLLDLMLPGLNGLDVLDALHRTRPELPVLILSARADLPTKLRGFDLGGTLTFGGGLTGLVFGISKGGLSGWTDPVVIGSLIAAAILLPLFVLIERRGRAPMLDLSIFANRMFSAATAAAFINGLSRFALMFLFVFYFQGPQNQSPIMAGLELAPLAIGMLVASPLAGIAAARRDTCPGRRSDTCPSPADAGCRRDAARPARRSAGRGGAPAAGRAGQGRQALR